METSIKFKSAPLTRFNSAHHAQFHTSMYQLLLPANRTLLHLSDELMNEWKACIDQEVEANREASMSIETARMHAKDEERDQCLTYLFEVIRAEMASPLPENRERARQLKIIIDAYKGVQQAANQDETMLISGLLNDLDRHPEKLEALRLRPITTLLRAANEAYERLQQARRTEQVETQIVPATKVRPQTDAIYERACQLIQAAYLFSTSPEDRSAISTQVEHMNRLIDQYRTEYLLSRAQQGSGTPGGTSHHPSDTTVYTGGGDDNPGDSGSGSGGSSSGGSGGSGSGGSSSGGSGGSGGGDNPGGGDTGGMGLE